MLRGAPQAPGRLRRASTLLPRIPRAPPAPWPRRAPGERCRTRGAMQRRGGPGTHIVDPMNTPTPPYEQVRREIVEQVRSGEIAPGDKLPAIRVLAGDLGLAAGTVARA
ncbi:MAG: GntR family transcriptional regulator, partial [Brachybacterium tyrofermentans]